MIGSYWTTGINVLFYPPSPSGEEGLRYGVALRFYDGGWCEDGSSEGMLRMRYIQSDLSAQVDALIADAGVFGIEFRHIEGRPPWLYVSGDGEYEDVYLPDDWREQLRVEAARIGWRTYDEVEK